MPDAGSETDRRIAASWEANADAWTAAVREGRIASRRAGTDAAIVAAVRRRPAGRLLDLGCGEGWLARALAAHGWTVAGLDGSAPLIERARELGGGEFRVATFEALAARPALAGGPYDVVALNFALLGEDVVPVLSAARRALAPGGAVVLQTVHPWSALGDAAYRDGWRTETFDAFGGAFPSPMPWYYRTLASWLRALGDAGLVLERLEEPTDPASGRPLSLLVTAGRGDPPQLHRGERPGGAVRDPNRDRSDR